MLTVVAQDGHPVDGSSLLDEIVREGSRRMLAAALEAEVDAYIAELAGQRDEHGRRLVARNGHAKPRQVMTSAGAVEVAAPPVNDKCVDPKFGKAVAKIADDVEELLASYDFPVALVRAGATFVNNQLVERPRRVVA